LTQTQQIPILGIGDDGLAGMTASARALVEQTEVLIGDGPTLSLLEDTGAERVNVGGDPQEAMRAIEAAGDRNVAVLVSGDPLFYGLARFLCDKLGKERFVVVPHVSSMQLAFARVMESWEEAYLTNLAHHPLEAVVERIRTSEKVGLFTTDALGPPQVAQALLDRGIDYFTAYVCENLGSPNECVTQGELADVAGMSFGSLNVMILVRRPEVPDKANDAVKRRLFGNREESFRQSKRKQGLLTPAEVRCLALSELDLSAESIVWDVGAGSGSVGVEAALIASSGTTYAIEMDPEDHALIQENAQRFGVKNLVAVLGRAPEAWADLPEPHAVFVQGNTREIARLVELACEQLLPGGRLVASVGSIENLAEVHQAMTRLSSDVQVWMLNHARGTHQLERVRFESLNPTFLLAMSKPAGA